MSEVKKRVLVVDDSVFARRIVSDILSFSPDLEVVGTAVDGRNAMRLAHELKPDVITLDIEMPGLDGIETLKRIMDECPTPVVMVSSLSTTGAQISIKALSIGAVDVIAKPHGGHSIGLTSQRDELIAKVIAAAKVDVLNLTPPNRQPILPHKNKTYHKNARLSNFPIVIIASSTGGPRALRNVVPQLSADNGAAYVVVQHLPEGFAGPLANDLNNYSDLEVRETFEGDTISPGELIIAKPGYHCVFNRIGSVKLTLDPTLWGVRPSADITMASAVTVFGKRLIGVVLTGMGRDGANGIRLIKQAGGTTLAEDESTCVVYGMPRSAYETGAIDRVIPLHKMADAINTAVNRMNNALTVH